MSQYRITARGCDDRTTVDLQMTAQEFATVKRVSEAINEAATYGCMPGLYIEPIETEGN